MNPEEIQRHWESSWTAQESKLLDEHIVAATKQKHDLEILTDKLAKELMDLDFNLEELAAVHEEISSFPEEEEIVDSEASFFQILTELENQEASLKVELDGYTQLRRDLGHDQNTLLHKLKLLKKNCEIEVNRVQSNTDKILVLENQLAHSKMILEDKIVTVNEIAETCNTLETEMQVLNEDLKFRGSSVLEELRARERELKGQVEETEKERISLEQIVANTRRTKQEEVDSAAQAVERAKSIKSWQHNRTVLAGRSKRLQNQAMTEKRNFESAQKRDDEVRRKIKELLGNNDPGDATGIKARQIVQSSIDDMAGQEINDDQVEELEMEAQFSKELDEQLKLLDTSIAKFQEYRDQTMKSLDEELANCSQKGYINLLEAEKLALHEGSSQ